MDKKHIFEGRRKFLNFFIDLSIKEIIAAILSLYQQQQQDPDMTPAH